MTFGVLDSDIIAAAKATSRAMVITDNLQRHNPIVFVNTAFTHLTGYSALEATGRNCNFLQGPATDANTVSRLRQAIAARRSTQCKILNYRKDGTSFWNDLAIDPIYGADGRTIGFVGVQYDCSELYEAAAARVEAEKRLKTVTDSVPGYIYQRILRPSGEVFYPYLSGSICRILGLPPDTENLVDRLISLIHRDDFPRFQKQMEDSARNMTPFSAEFRLMSVSGQEHWFRSEGAPRKAASGDIVWEGLAVEITAEKIWEARVGYLAQHDALTGLPTRLLFGASVARMISGAAAGETRAAIFSIDIDGFHNVNDALGSVIGDRVLHRIGLRLREYAEPLGGIAARLSSDEFAVLLPGIDGPASARGSADAINAQLRRPVIIDGEHAVVGASIGVALFPDPADAARNVGIEDWPVELLKRANLALQLAKRDGAGTCRLYSEEVDDRLRLEPQLRISLGRALAEEQFALHYQPIVDMASGDVVGAEALLRWEHPELGLQRSDMFIPMAESSGLIVPLGAWVIRNVFQQAEAWRREGLTPAKIAINVSSIQLQKPGFLAAVEQAVLETGARPAQFELELTEGILLHDSVEMKSLFGALRAMGFGLVIDDFGTGHATFAYLRSFALDKLKIDQVFIRHLVAGSSDAAIIRAIIALCRNLNLQVVAEGVETPKQRSFLLDEGCILGQGYLFSLPLPGEDFGRLLQSGRPLPALPAQPGAS